MEAEREQVESLLRNYVIKRLICKLLERPKTYYIYYLVMRGCYMALSVLYLRY